MTESKVKLYKNPDRSKPEHRKAYTPQYQVMGVEPEEFRSAVAPTTQVIAAQSPQTSDNPRTRRPGMRQPYAETVASPVGRGRGPVPNVGNNMEHTWSSVDGEIIDDLSLDETQPMVDNNDFVSAAALGLPEESHEELPALDEVVNPPPKRFVAQPEPTATPDVDADDILLVLHNLAEGDYLLMVDGVAVCSGPAEEIQEQARLLVFGEHEMCDGNPTPVDDIVVIKRISIKVGLFLE
jgi:hypothetical protein